GAHLDAQVVLEIDVPSRSVADHVAVARPDDLRALPEGLGKRGKAKRRVETLARLHHVDRRVALLLQEIADVIADIARAFRGGDVIDVAPFLRPHVAEQSGPDGARRGLDRPSRSTLALC